MKKLKLKVFILLGLAGFGINAYALGDDPLELPPVTVTGARLWSTTFSFDLSFLIPASLFKVDQQAWRGNILWEEYQEARAFVRDAVTSRLTIPDARCNTFASDATKTITSRDDSTTRFLAAFQLFTAIAGYNGVAALRGVINGSTPAIVAGKYVATFEMTYMDGSSEKFEVMPGITPALIIEGNIPPPPSGDGTIKACPLLH